MRYYYIYIIKAIQDTKKKIYGQTHDENMAEPRPGDGVGSASGSSPHACASSVKPDKKYSVSRVKDKGTKYFVECRLSAYLALLYNFRQTLLLGRLAGWY